VVHKSTSLEYEPADVLVEMEAKYPGTTPLSGLSSTVFRVSRCQSVYCSPTSLPAADVLVEMEAKYPGTSGLRSTVYRDSWCQTVYCLPTSLLAADVLVEMEAKGVAPTVATFTALIM
jgi:hypothetical protein